MLFKPFSIIFFLFIVSAYAQNKKKELKVKLATDEIRVDGVMDENAWVVADIADHFSQVRPYDSSLAVHQSEIRITFDKKNIYVGGKIYQPKKDYTVSSLKRDFLSGASDVVFVSLDTFNDQLNGFQFSLSPYNVQREGLISSGDNVDNAWDNVWHSQVKNYDEYWVFEMAIPFTSIRYKIKDGVNIWGLNIGRFFMKSNEVSAWNPVPRNFRPTNLGFSGKLIWESPPPRPNFNATIIPYVSTSLLQDYPRGEDLGKLSKNKNTDIGFGMDAKIALSPSLNLDLTVNPDFSQVEVDQQQTNLSRFELFFPEKRQFFLENFDLFGVLGFPNTRPFFSRRIGLVENPKNDGQFENVPIWGGARLSGKINRDWRVGLLNIQTKSKNFGDNNIVPSVPSSIKKDAGDNNIVPSSNYTVGVVQRNVLSRSTISGILVNQYNILVDDQTSLDFDRYHRLGGLEFNYFSKDNRWEYEAYYHRSFSEKKQKNESSYGQYLGFQHPHLNISTAYSQIGDNYNAPVGYVPRRGIHRMFNNTEVILNPKSPNISKHLNSYGMGVEINSIFNFHGKKLDNESTLYGFLKSPTSTQMAFGYSSTFTHLSESFDPTNSSDNPNPDVQNQVVKLPIGNYTFKGCFAQFKLSPQWPLHGEVEYSFGNYYNGKSNSLKINALYRWQPYLMISMAFEQTRIKLPKPYYSVNYLLIAPKADISFTRSLFLGTYLQYNSQINNLNFNARLQWRYKPVSDIFLVITNNYFAEEISKYNVQTGNAKNSAIILKWTYWLNI